MEKPFWYSILIWDHNLHIDKLVNVNHQYNTQRILGIRYITLAGISQGSTYFIYELTDRHLGQSYPNCSKLLRPEGKRVRNR